MHRPVRHDRPRPAAARRGARASPTCSSIATPHPEYRRPRSRRAGRRHLEPARATERACERPSQPRVSVVIPVYNEGDDIVPCLDRLVEAVTLPCEILVVFDSPDDTTRAGAREVRRATSRGSCPTLNTYGRGPGQRDPLRHRPRHGAGRRRHDGRRLRRPAPDRRAGPAGRARRGRRRRLAATCRGGQQVGGPLLKRIAVPAGRAARCTGSPGSAPATPPTRSRPTTASSCSEVGIEVRRRLRDRHRARRQGARGCGGRSPRSRRSGSTARSASSNFKLGKWLPRYLHWYRYAFGPQLDVRAAAPPRRTESIDAHVSDAEGPGHRLGRLHRRLPRRGAARPRPRGRRHRQLLEVRPGREVLRRPPGLPASSRATPATSS